MSLDRLSRVLPDGTIIGSVPGVLPGTFFRDRQHLHDTGLHRGLMRGIAPHGSSVVLSGGYADDEDRGDEIIYTGEGGRDASSGRQIADQLYAGGNDQLAQAHLSGMPVRLHRSSKYAPTIPAGFRYRYEGLFRVVQTWRERGRDGFMICRFRLERIADSEVQLLQPAPEPGRAPHGNQQPRSTVARVTRVVRDTEVSDFVKLIHDHTCQICGIRLMTPRGPYAEGAHIKPLGRPHRGPDEVSNVLCLCPNCHVQFDEVTVWLDDELSIRGSRSGNLKTSKAHEIDLGFIRYHRGMGQ
jgi:putative restriction endonuclease